jgi:N-methylhydantoinase B
MVMDHGRAGPQGMAGGEPGGVNKVAIVRSDGATHIPEHLSKDQGITLQPGDAIDVRTPGGGGYGAPQKRDPHLAHQDAQRGYF